jgi:hypothetical protein
MSAFRMRVIIVGAGVAGLEASLALRALVGDRVDITLVSPEPSSATARWRSLTAPGRRVCTASASRMWPGTSEPTGTEGRSASWPLPLYDLALTTAAQCASYEPSSRVAVSRWSHGFAADVMPDGDTSAGDSTTAAELHDLEVLRDLAPHEP